MEPKFLWASEDRRILLIKIDIDGKKAVLVNIYAPNVTEDGFFQKLNKKLEQWCNLDFVIMRDFNGMSSTKLSEKMGNGEWEEGERKD